ncbi:MAG: hypothetical protein DRJ10_06840 [Bacteroidetes bacterium]|nr:MAG: hypothetical protein DRJ10_06840 [Bacteroidota bacterium]
MANFIRKILIILNIITALFLIFAYLSAYISPADFSFFAFFGLIYPFLLIINILFIVYWLLKRNKFFLLSTLTVLLGWSFLSSFFQLSFNKKAFEKNEQQVKVLSYNVRIFNLWNWSSEKTRTTKTYNYIKNSKSNIVCLQEFYSNNTAGKNAKDTLLNSSILKYAHISFAKSKNKIYHHGIATFTSYPIIKKGIVQLEDYENFCIYTDLKIDKDTIRVYNLHLESIHLGHNDYQTIDNINNDTAVDVIKYTSILKKLRTGYIKRSRQVDIISAHVDKSPYPVIVCGDFNDPPFSYSYNRITRKLKDAFKESGNGISSTYIHKYSTFRIDYILHSPSLKSFNFKRLKVELSDHYPIESVFQTID